MDAYECIMTRRSIRKYLDKPVEDDLIQKILEAGGNAPSAGNQQPWHFIVVKERKTLEQMAEDHPYGKMLAHAAVAIVVCMDREGIKYPMLAVDDCAAATENILLAAHALGLGAVWLGVHNSADRVNDVAQTLDIPSRIDPFGIVSIGHPDEFRETKVRLRPERVHREKW